MASVLMKNIELINTEEKFKSMESFNRYLFSDFGRIYDMKTDRFISLLFRKDLKILYCYLRNDDNEVRRYMVKDAIYKTFINPSIPVKMMVKCKDEDSYNLRADNLHVVLRNQDAVRDLTGQVIGRLTVLRQVESVKHGTCWECRCECGVIKTYLGNNIKRDTKSCGCWFKEMIRHKNNSLIHTHNNKWTGYGEISGNFWGAIVQGAIKRNYEFTITIAQAWELFLKQEGKCALSKMDLIMKGRAYKTASLDRIDNTMGYILDNIQWVHKHINRMKTDHKQDYFIELCKNVAYNS